MKPEINHHPTILVIDPDEEDCFLFAEAITEISSQIAIVTTDGTDHLWKTIAKTKPSVIFIEYVLPRDNGIEWVKRIKCHPVLQSIPIVMWSTTNLHSVKSAAFKAGVQNYLEKPWELKKWMEQIKKVLQQNQIELPAFEACYQENFFCPA